MLREGKSQYFSYIACLINCLPFEFFLRVGYSQGHILNAKSIGQGNTNPRTWGSLMSLMMIALIAVSIKNAPVPFFIRPITNRVAGNIQSSFLEPNFATHFTFLEGQLKTSGGSYLCGPNLTGADIMLSFPLIAGGSRAGLTKEKYPTLHAYVERLENEPGYKKAADKIIEIDGKFEATL